jgi:cyclophilin family peptidyl-prolyl cis-trans isomerase
MSAFAKEGAASPRVALETSKGTVVLELAAQEAPQTVESFLDNVASGFYEGTIFHRVIDGFMAQGGGYGEDLGLRSTNKALVNEADNGLVNERGTIAMARTSDPHSASVQFFINLVDNNFLNHRGKDPQGWGYAVFGRVVEGMEVVDAIGKAPTSRRSGMDDVPVETVLITRASVV